MKNQELAEIKARYEATTIAPWVASIEGRDHELGGSSFIMTGIPKGEYIWQAKRGEDLEIAGATIADLDFIANARQDIPTLVAEIERLQKIVQNLSSSNMEVSKIVGKLQQKTKDIPEWWTSEVIEIPFLNGEKLMVTFINHELEQDKKFMDEADTALGNFLKFNISDRNEISEHAYKNCMDFLAEIDVDEYDEPLRKITDKNDIWNFIQPRGIYIERRFRRDRDIYIKIACECHWEQEHGLQFVFRQGKQLTRISAEDGHLTEADAYDKPDLEDNLLSSFKIE